MAHESKGAIRHRPRRQGTSYTAYDSVRVPGGKLEDSWKVYFNPPKELEGKIAALDTASDEILAASSRICQPPGAHPGLQPGRARTARQDLDAIEGLTMVGEPSGARLSCRNRVRCEVRRRSFCSPHQRAGSPTIDTAPKPWPTPRSLGQSPDPKCWTSVAMSVNGRAWTGRFGFAPDCHDGQVSSDNQRIGREPVSGMQSWIVIPIPLLLGHDLFRKPGPTFRSPCSRPSVFAWKVLARVPLFYRGLPLLRERTAGLHSWPRRWDNQAAGSISGGIRRASSQAG